MVTTAASTIATLTHLPSLTPVDMSLLRTAASKAVASRVSMAPMAARTFASSSTIRSKDPQLGDYPDIPPVSRQRRKFDKNYWDPQEKANFGETVSVEMWYGCLAYWIDLLTRRVSSCLHFPSAPRTRRHSWCICT